MGNWFFALGAAVVVAAEAPVTDLLTVASDVITPDHVDAVKRVPREPPTLTTPVQRYQEQGQGTPVDQGVTSSLPTRVRRLHNGSTVERQAPRITVPLAPFQVNTQAVAEALARGLGVTLQSLAGAVVTSARLPSDLITGGFDVARSLALQADPFIPPITQQLLQLQPLAPVFTATSDAFRQLHDLVHAQAGTIQGVLSTTTAAPVVAQSSSSTALG